MRNGRYIKDHTKRKGFWIEDWLTGRKYYLNNQNHIKAVVGLLNDYTSNDRFVSYESKVGDVIEDTNTDDVYVLGDSSHVNKIKKLLNEFDFGLYGERELPYKRVMM